MFPLRKKSHAAVPGISTCWWRCFKCASNSKQSLHCNKHSRHKLRLSRHVSLSTIPFFSSVCIVKKTSLPVPQHKQFMCPGAAAHFGHTSFMSHFREISQDSPSRESSNGLVKQQHNVSWLILSPQLANKPKGWMHLSKDVLWQTADIHQCWLLPEKHAVWRWSWDRNLLPQPATLLYSQWYQELHAHRI